MTATRSGCGIAALAMLLCASSLTAQETALKGGLAISRFNANGTGANPWDDRLIGTSLGGHVRFRFGRIALQPELAIVTRGASKTTPSQDYEEEQLRLEYLEIPVLLVLPIRLGPLEPYIFGGGMISLESRCRYVQKAAGLKSSFGCEAVDPSVFNHRVFDYGVVGGGGASYPIGSGRIFVEARQTLGLRNMVDDVGFAELRNRTTVVGIGYSVDLAAMRNP